MESRDFKGFHEIQHWNQQDFIMDFTVDSITGKSVIKFIMKSANEINDILKLNLMKLNLMTSCQMLWISWTPVKLCGFNEILLLLINF